MNPFTYAQITTRTEEQITQLMTHAQGNASDFGRRLQADWAYGAYLLWYRLTCGWQADGDNERLEALTRLDDDKKVAA